MSDTPRKEDRSPETTIREKNLGYVMKKILKANGVKVPGLEAKIGATRFKAEITEDMIYKMLEGKSDFKPIYIGVILEAAKIDPMSVYNAFIEVSEEAMKDETLYYKRPYHPRKDRKEDDN